MALNKPYNDIPGTTIFDADAKSLREIARESRALAEKVRAGTVTPPELSGGTFTEIEVGSLTVRDLDIDAASSRVSLGLSWFP